jgi:hypothetical protein
VAIKADGDCCYHLAGVIGSLSKDPGAVASSRAPCSAADLLVTRNQILDNFRRWQESKKPFCTSESDLEAFVLEATGETSATLVARVSGVAKGKDRWGSSADLALYTLYDDVRVVVIDADAILSGTADEDLLKTCSTATLGGTCSTSRVVCAILSKNHYQLGVVLDPQVRAVLTKVLSGTRRCGSS